MAKKSDNLNHHLVKPSSKRPPGGKYSGIMNAATQRIMSTAFGIQVWLGASADDADDADAVT